MPPIPSLLAYDTSLKLSATKGTPAHWSKVGRAEGQGAAEDVVELVNMVGVDSVAGRVGAAGVVDDVTGALEEACNVGPPVAVVDVAGLVGVVAVVVDVDVVSAKVVELLTLVLLANASAGVEQSSDAVLPAMATAPIVERRGTLPPPFSVAAIVHSPPKAPRGNSYTAALRLPLPPLTRMK